MAVLSRTVNHLHKYQGALDFPCLGCVPTRAWKVKSKAPKILEILLLHSEERLLSTRLSAVLESQLTFQRDDEKYRVV